MTSPAPVEIKDTAYHGGEYARATALRYISAFLARLALQQEGK